MEREPSPFLVEIAATVLDSQPVDWVRASREASATEQAAVLELQELERLFAEIRSEQELLVASSATSAAADSPIGNWGHLQILEKVGAGAKGEVFRALDTNLNQEVALKLFHRNVLRDDKDALLAEGQRHARVRHSNVVRIYGADEHEGQVGIWMEYIRGSTLAQLMRSASFGTFSPAEATLIGLEVCRALEAVHRAGLTHGDIKAENIMREKGGRIVLMDFSTSQPIDIPENQKALAGTPLYMAPELFGGTTTASAQSDVYGLGVLLFHLVTGDFPVRAETLCELTESHEKGRARAIRDLRGDIPEHYLKAAGHALERDPDKRAPTTGAIERLLASGQPQSDVVMGLLSFLRIQAAAVHRVLKIGMGLAGVAAVLTLVGYLAWRHFYLTVRMPPQFQDGRLFDYFATGLRSVQGVIIYTLLEDVFKANRYLIVASVLGYIAFYRRINRGIRFIAARLSKILLRVDSAALAALLLLAAIASISSVYVRYEAYVSQIAYKLGDPSFRSQVDMTILAPKCEDYHLAFDHEMMWVTVLFAGAIWALFTFLKRHAPPSPLLSVFKVVSVLVILTGLVLSTASWHFMWIWYPPVSIEGEKGYVVSQKSDEVFVYIPRGQGQRVLEATDAVVSLEAIGVPEHLFTDFDRASCP